MAEILASDHTGGTKSSGSVDDEFQTSLLYLPMEFDSDQLCTGGGVPRLWNEVHPDAWYLSSDEFRAGKHIGQRTRQQLFGEHDGERPFTPYIEKQVWKPDELATSVFNENIDINVIRNWINTCTDLHGSLCDRPIASSEESVQAMFFIDVENSRLVPATPGVRYVALSYIWGECKLHDTIDCLTSANLPELLKAQSFVQNGIHMSRVIHNAMDLVRNLNEKFLWVDRFCIPQDDGPNKQSQLDSMALIYSSAWLTIFAAQNSNANQGLYGDRMVTDLAPEEMKTADLGNEETKIMSTDALKHLSNKEIINYNARALMCSQWFSRGWTFQEHICSGRRLLFHNNIIGWECQASSWHESQDVSEIAANYALPSPKIPSGSQCIAENGWPNFYRYTCLISLYNRRAFTYPEDVFDGFRGILSLFARSFTGTNISGLPEIFFNAGLLWQPWTPLRRRKAKGCAEKDALLPSWSWLGWSGDIQSESWALGYSYLRPVRGRGIDPDLPLPLEIMKTIDWVYSHNLKSERKSITDMTLEYRHNTTDILQLDGWTKREPRSEMPYWQHRSELTQDFWYPIPIAENNSNKQDFGISARFIHGKTRRAFFNLGTTISSSKASNCMVLELMNPRDNEWAGFLRLSHLFYEQPVVVADQCELIELSAGSFEAGGNGKYLLDEWERILPSIRRKRYEFYNVMCIKQKRLDDCTVAYRRALGRIEKSQWDSLATEFDVTIG